MDNAIVVLTVATAVVFDFTNGFHDTANAMATTIATRALPPRAAVGLASVLNFAGAFISVAVAATIASGIVEQGDVTVPIIFAGLVGAILWNATTWFFGIPSSSSHALVGGVVGAVLAGVGLAAPLPHPRRRRERGGAARHPARARGPLARPLEAPARRARQRHRRRRAAGGRRPNARARLTARTPACLHEPIILLSATSGFSNCNTAP